VQEICLDIWQHAARYDAEKASESTFIALIARRRLIDRVRRNARRPQFQNLEDVSLAQPRCAERQMQIRLDAGRISKFIAQLRPEQKQVINLAIFGGMTHTEIAERTGLPLGTVKTLIRRGFQRVRDSFGGGEDSFAPA
jgi:RNA polymerase sigma-70 factor (ECF subfamily)